MIADINSHVCQTPQGTAFKKSLSNAINDHFSDTENLSILSIAIILDSRHKHIIFYNSSFAGSALRKIDHIPKSNFSQPDIETKISNLTDKIRNKLQEESLKPWN